MSVVIVGAGISGSVAARILAEKGTNVIVYEKNDHIGGNCYDYYDENNICVHKYGTHIFHTDDKKIWDFLSRFTKFHPYMHKVLGFIDGQLVPIPFNLNSIAKLFPADLAQRLENKLVKKFGLNTKIPILDLKNSEDEDFVFLADFVYNKVFLNYTMKQWDSKPEDIDPYVTARVPISISKDDRYFQNKYQGIPMKGYTEMFKNILNHPNIKLVMNTDWNDVKDQHINDEIYYSGPIDELMDYEFGELPYRSVQLDFVTYDQDYFQECSVVNYPNNYDFTRIGEYKYFLNDKSKKTVVSFEYPQKFVNGKNLRFYPIVSEKNTALYNKYYQLAKNKYPNIRFLGRLGDYKYYDMDKAVSKVFELFDSE